MEPLEQLIAAILKRLQKGANALELLPGYKNPENEPLWRADARLYRAFARKLISQGHPTRGLEVAREGLKHHPNEQELRYLLALARTRGGDLRGAAECLAELNQMTDLTPHLQAEGLSLEGRIYKDRYVRSRDPEQKKRFAVQSAASYRRAAALPGAGSFPVINAATMTFLAGDTALSRELAKEAITRAERERQEPDKAEDYWLLATLGEARFLLGELDEAATWYRKAVANATQQGDIGSIGSMRHNALLLKEGVEVSAELLDMFHEHTGSVVAFAGHMIDHPQRGTRDGLAPRFPSDPQLIRSVRDKIKTHLADLNATVGFCSAACGSDILFAEQMLDRGAELHIVLPFAVDDFYATSVDFDPPKMTEWQKRFDAVLARVPPENVHFATTEPYLGDAILFDFVNRFTQGLAVTRAAQRGVVPQALVVLDPGAPVRPGGTGYFLKTWKDAERQSLIIDLRELRQGIFGEEGPPTGTETGSTEPRAATGRQIKAMLFADVKDFSKLEEENSPRFFQRFLAEVGGVLGELPNKPTFGNTWGDGLYLVFDEATHCAEAALRLLERAEQIDWKALGLGEASPLRIGAHAGPVFSGFDPIMGKTNYYGSHVTRAARIEPVTIPGCAFVSEQLAALLAIDPARDYVCEYIGIEPLAKGYDHCPLYRLARR